MTKFAGAMERAGEFLNQTVFKGIKKHWPEIASVAMLSTVLVTTAAMINDSTMLNNAGCSRADKRAALFTLVQDVKDENKATLPESWKPSTSKALENATTTPQCSQTTISSAVFAVMDRIEEASAPKTAVTAGTSKSMEKVREQYTQAPKGLRNTAP